MWQRHRSLLLALLLALLFLLGTTTTSTPISRDGKAVPEGQVVISAPVQLLMFAGDRYLAANLEAIRAATIGLTDTSHRGRAAYRLRSHRVVARLNPCHEDNYYLGNAVLTWGGQEEAGNELLQRATECRFWDQVPPFFYGFNQYFFHRNIEQASQALEKAARRSSQNAAALRKLAIMIRAEQMDDNQMAVNYLREQLKQTEDPKLQKMLDKRLRRLLGLITLRQAQQRYEAKTGQPLAKPQQLISSGVLEQLPRDPLRLGYTFDNGKFSLKQLKIQGMGTHQ